MQTLCNNRLSEKQLKYSKIKRWKNENNEWKKQWIYNWSACTRNFPETTDRDDAGRQIAGGLWRLEDAKTHYQRVIIDRPRATYVPYTQQTQYTVTATTAYITGCGSLKIPSVKLFSVNVKHR